MLAYIAKTARSIFVRPIEEPLEEEEIVEPKNVPHQHRLEVTMVKTRQGVDTTPPIEITPASSVKRTVGDREIEDLEDTLRSSKKQKNLASYKTESPPVADAIVHTGHVLRKGSPKVVIPRKPRSSIVAVETPQKGTVLIDEHRDLEDSAALQSSQPFNEHSGRKKKNLRKDIAIGTITTEALPHLSGPISTSSQENVLSINSPQEISPLVMSAVHELDVRGDTEGQLERQMPAVNMKVSSVFPSNTAEAVHSDARDGESLSGEEAFEKESKDATGLYSQMVDSDDGSEASEVIMEDSVPKKELSIRIHHQDEAPPKAYQKPSKRKIASDYLGTDDASDSDEAPEVVTTAAAVSKANTRQSEARRAYEAEEEKQRQRSQYRSERMAREQAEKQARAKEKAGSLVNVKAKKNRRENKSPAPGSSALLSMDAESLPDRLPDSLLEAISDQRPPTPPLLDSARDAKALQQQKLKRHIKFLEHGEKPAKDVKKGSFHVSVLAQQNTLLPPKMNMDVRLTREQWLQGRRDRNPRTRGKGKGKVLFRKMERRPAVGRSFLRNGDE